MQSKISLVNYFSLVIYFYITKYDGFNSASCLHKAETLNTLGLIFGTMHMHMHMHVHVLLF